MNQVKECRSRMPCPHCGSFRTFVNFYGEPVVGGSIWFVQCTGCNAQGPDSGGSRKAIRLWNTRSRPLAAAR